MSPRRISAAASLFRRSIRHNRLSGWLIVLAAAWPAAALAQFQGTPYAAASYEYNSNVFALPSTAAKPIGNGGPTFADKVLRSRAGLEAKYDWSRQEFYLNAEGRRFDYQHFRSLNHNEYLLNGGLKWKIASLLDGALDYQRERSMVSFLDFTATQLYLQVQDLATASVNLQVSPEWRLESRGKINKLDSPRPGAPNLNLREQSIHEGLRYVGFANLSAGLDGEYLEGHFSSGAFLVTPRYHQSTAELAADYMLSGLSTFNSAIGYTRRVQQQVGTISGVTGLLAYQRSLTGKTSFNLKLSRAINSYVTGAGTEVDTGALLDVIWKATAKITVDAGYQWQHSNYPGFNIVGSATSDRIDRYQQSMLSVKYQALDWLSLRPYAQYQTRVSNTAVFTFNGAIYGLEAQARLPNY